MKERILNYYIQMDSQYLDSNKKRFEWVDVCKGILICYVIMGHSSSIIAPYAYLFHIPIFFFLAGYVERLQEKSMIQIFVQKFVSLIIPYMVTNILFLLIRVGMNLFGVQGYFYSEIISVNQLFDYVKKILNMQWTTDFGGATWFLCCLFVAFLLAKTLDIIAKDWSVLLAGVFYLIAFWLDLVGILLRYYLDIAFLGAFYILLGNFCKKNKIFDYLTVINWKLWCFVFFIYCEVFTKYFKCSVDWASRNYGHPMLSFVSVSLAIIILMNISKSIQRMRIGARFKFYGQESMPLMLLHFLIFRLIYALLVVGDIYPTEILKNLTPPNAGIFNILYWFATLAVFEILHKLFKNVLIYKWFYEGKIQVPKEVKEGAYNKYSGIVVLLVVYLGMSIIPYQEIVYKLEKVEYEYQLEGVYEDNFVGKEFSIKLNIDNSVDVSFQLYNPMNIKGTCDIYLDGNYYFTHKVGNEIVDVKLSEIEANISDITVIFSDTIIPSKMNLGKDERELSVLLIDGDVCVERSCYE